MMRFMSCLLALVLVVPIAAAQEADYTPDQIVAYFSEALACPPGTPCLRKKDTRAICIGNANACRQQEKATQPEDRAFDLLITFELGSDRLSDQAELNLEQFALALMHPALSEVVFNIAGHTDARGEEDYNLDLSERRAQSVVAYLRALGIPEERLTPKGFGEGKPRVKDPFADVNRRVEATIRTQ